MMEKIQKNKTSAILVSVYLISLLPILMAGRYAYPQADDWEYSHRVHIAWEDTHSLFRVLEAVWETVSESYVEWQGTFSSIALMSLQPEAFVERGYVLVPFLMVGLLTLAMLIFFHELFRRVEGADWLSIAMLVLFVTIQCVVSKPVAFYWYNGAVHYMAMYGIGLLLVAYLLKCVRGERMRWGYQVTACLLAVILGGGNLVTGLSGAIGFATLFVLGFLTGKKKMQRLILPAVCNYAAFAINVLAPGNWKRQEEVGEHSAAVMSILRSLYYGIYYSGMEWLDWVLVLMILGLIPIAWRMAGKVEFRFPYPLLVSAYSYCFLSAMFTPTDYAAGTVTLGRVQNVIYAVYVLLAALNTVYLTGWFRKHIRVEIKSHLPLKKIYYGSLGILAIYGMLMYAVPSPQYFTSLLAIHDMADGSAQEFARLASENIEALKGEEMVVEVHQMPHDSRLLTSEDIDVWHFGTRLFFRKEKVEVLKEPGTG